MALALRMEIPVIRLLVTKNIPTVAVAVARAAGGIVAAAAAAALALSSWYLVVGR